MIILDFIFTDINRTGSTSVRDALGLRDKAMHQPAFVKKDSLGEETWETTTSFSIIRNPYERAVSQYLHRKCFHDDVETLFEFLKKVHIRKQYYWQPEDARYLPRLFWPQVNFLMDKRFNEIIVDELIQFSNLEEGVRDLTGYEIPHRGSANVNKPYASFIDFESKKLIDLIYEEDFERLGYTKSLDSDKVENQRKLF